MTLDDHRATLSFYNGAAQFSVTSLVAVAVVQFSILLLLEGKGYSANGKPFQIYASLFIAYIVIVILGAYLIYNYLLFARLLESVRRLPLLAGMYAINERAREDIGESVAVRRIREFIVIRHWYGFSIVFLLFYGVTSFLLLHSVWSLPP